jgi:hypothetical protein
MASEIMNELNSAPWQLGLLTDCRGHIHLGAVLADTNDHGPVYVDLLAPVGASNAADLDLDRLVVLVRGDHVADLRRLVERCIDDVRLRDRLVELADLATLHTVMTPWTA